MTNACCLKFSSSIKMDPMINVSHLKPYVKREDGDPMQILKKSKIIDWAKDFDVKRILNHRHVGRGMQFLVEWLGWKESEVTWEPTGNLKNASNMMREYLELHPE